MPRATLRPEAVTKSVGHAGKIAADQGKKIRRLGEGIVPDGEVTAGAGNVALRDRIAVRQQHGRGGAVGFDAHGIDGEHVGPVEEIGDAAEAFGLALGAIGAARAIEAGQGGVRLGIAQGDDFKGEGLSRHGGDAERAGVSS